MKCSPQNEVKTMYITATMWDIQTEDLESLAGIGIGTPTLIDTPMCVIPEPRASFIRKKSRMSFPSISSNISKQFGLGSKSVDELEWVELITNPNLEMDEESTGGMYC